MNPCYPNVGSTSSLTYTISGLTEAQLTGGVTMQLPSGSASVSVTNTDVSGAVVKDSSQTIIPNISVKATGTFTF